MPQLPAEGKGPIALAQFGLTRRDHAFHVQNPEAVRQTRPCAKLRPTRRALL